VLKVNITVLGALFDYSIYIIGYWKKNSVDSIWVDMGIGDNSHFFTTLDLHTGIILRNF
jgi:hypothetical protein